MITTGELLIELLESYGVDTIFGIPGVHTLELYRGLQRADIRHVTPRHEQGAGFMADGYARVTGKPGVCLIITGPGMTNISTAMGQAYGDSIPMLVISSTNAHNECGLGEGHLHELHAQSALIEGVSKFSQTIMRPDDLPSVLARAFSVFEGSRPRPVHIEIPIDILQISADHVSCSSAVCVRRPAPDPGAIDQAFDWLSNAEKPMVLFGGGTVDAGREARHLVELLDAPTGLTINAKGVLPRGHPLLCGSYIPYKPMLEYIAEADVVLAVGTEMGETDYDVYRNGAFAINGKLIRIDIEVEQTVRNYQADLSITSDAYLALKALGERFLNGVTSPPGAGRKQAQTIRLDSEIEIADWAMIHKPWFDAILAVHDDPIIVGDSTQPIYSANHIYDAQSPRSYFNSATGYGTLGYGLPASIGAKIAMPDRPVICVTGDGGILFTIGELASAVEIKAGIVILLWNNEGYQTITDYMISGQIDPIGCIEFTPDFRAIAKGFGCEVEYVDRPDTLSEKLESAIGRDVPTLIEIRHNMKEL